MVNTWTWGNFYYTQPTNVNVSRFNDCKQCIYTDFHECQTIGVPALGAASPLQNQGKGCGRLVRERRQPLSFCLEERTRKCKILENLPLFVILRFKTKWHLHIPANQRPWSAFTVAIAAGIEGHFTYTLPYVKEEKKITKYVTWDPVLLSNHLIQWDLWINWNMDTFCPSIHLG